MLLIILYFFSGEKSISLIKSLLVTDKDVKVIASVLLPKLSIFLVLEEEGFSLLSNLSLFLFIFFSKIFFCFFVSFMLSNKF